jgi:DNA modification methylase
MKAFRSSAIGLKDAAREKRDSMPARVEKMKEIIDADPETHYIIWHDREKEREMVINTLKGYDVAEVYGSQDLEKREKTIVEFSEGRVQLLATKPSISGQGCNFQYHCHKAIFLGIGYEFNDFIQAIHRVYRFQQKKQVEIHIIYAESEEEILKTLQRKWKQHEKLVDEMTRIMRENGLSSTNVQKKLLRSIGIERREVKGELFTSINNDCALEAISMKTDSIDMVVTSIPFSNHYEYTPSYNDFGHTQGDDHFFRQMDFLTPNLLRVLRPGRVAAIHVKDRILFGNATGTGMPTVNPFHAHTIFHYIKHGFQYMGMITIETDVVRENNQTYRLGWSEQCKDGSKMGIGSPEYVLLFRKLPTDTSKAYADTPVSKSKKEYGRGRWQIDARAKWNSSGNRFMTREEMYQTGIDKINRYFSDFFSDKVYSFEKHTEVAAELEKMGKLPATFETLKIPARSKWVWHDVNRMHTLNSDQSRKKLQMHVCPLQFDIVDRLITRYTNKGELIFDPFGGLMTVPVRAMKLGRKGIATELNPDYFNDGVRHCKATEAKITAPTLFDMLELEDKEVA